MTHDADEDCLLWTDLITKDVIEAITRRRKELEMTAQELADDTRLRGFEVPRNVIANWESGRRKTITVPELVMVAEALMISPAELAFSPALGGRVKYLPYENETRWSAFSRFTGEHPHADGRYRLSLYRRHARLWEVIAEEHHDAIQLQFNGWRDEWPPSSEDQFDALVAAVRSQLHPIRAELRDRGWEVPGLATHLEFLNAELPPLNTDLEPEDE
jgi:transcriptional regulator with XRE-family HTH domain